MRGHEHPTVDSSKRMVAADIRGGGIVINMNREHPGYIQNKDDLVKRLRRIAGQVGGVERMVDDERYCIDILTQVSAIQSDPFRP